MYLTHCFFHTAPEKNCDIVLDLIVGACTGFTHTHDEMNDVTSLQNLKSIHEAWTTIINVCKMHQDGWTLRFCCKFECFFTSDWFRRCQKSQAEHITICFSTPEHEKTALVPCWLVLFLKFHVHLWCNFRAAFIWRLSSHWSLDSWVSPPLRKFVRLLLL